MIAIGANEVAIRRAAKVPLIKASTPRKYAKSKSVDIDSIVRDSYDAMSIKTNMLNSAAYVFRLDQYQVSRIGNRSPVVRLMLILTKLPPRGLARCPIWSAHQPRLVGKSKSVDGQLGESGATRLAGAFRRLALPSSAPADVH